MATHRLHDENGNFYLRKDNEGNFFVNTDNVTPPPPPPPPPVPPPPPPPPPPPVTPTPTPSNPPLYGSLEAGYYCVGSPTDVEGFCHDPACGYHEGGDFYTWCNTINGPYDTLEECEAACSGTTPTPTATPTVTSTPTGT